MRWKPGGLKSLLSFMIHSAIFQSHNEAVFFQGSRHFLRLRSISSCLIVDLTVHIYKNRKRIDTLIQLSKKNLQLLNNRRNLIKETRWIFWLDFWFVTVLSLPVTKNAVLKAMVTVLVLLFFLFIALSKFLLQQYLSVSNLYKFCHFLTISSPFVLHHSLKG